MLVGVFKLLKWEDNRDLPERSPLAMVEEPPAPVLQSVPSLELGEYRRQQRKLLDEYQWIDKQQQIVRIPIDQATQLLAERGLPKVPPAATAGSRRGSGKAGRGEAGSGGVAMKYLSLDFVVGLLGRLAGAVGVAGAPVNRRSIRRRWPRRPGRSTACWTTWHRSTTWVHRFRWIWSFATRRGKPFAWPI